jgi:hypothetical protein
VYDRGEGREGVGGTEIRQTERSRTSEGETRSQPQVHYRDGVDVREVNTYMKHSHRDTDTDTDKPDLCVP